MAGTRRSVMGRIGLGIGIAILLGSVVLGVRGLLYDTGHLGSTGTFRASTCADGDSGRRCTGTYISGDGHLKDPRAHVTLNTDAEGKATHVDRAGPGDYRPLGGDPVIEDIALIAAMPTRNHRRGRRRGPQASWPMAPVAGGVSGGSRR